jgi:hypothetical protein
MPPLKHSLIGKSEVIEWIIKQFQIEEQLAAAVFSSSKQAKYIVQHDGRWQGDARSGYEFWRKGGKSGEKSGKSKQSHEEMLQIAEYKTMLNAVFAVMDQKQRNLTIAEVKEVIGTLWPNDPLCAARRKLALRLYNNYMNLSSDTAPGAKITAKECEKEDDFNELTKELARHPYEEIDPEEPVLTPEEERAQTLEAAKARFKYLKKSYGM